MGRPNHIYPEAGKLLEAEGYDYDPRRGLGVCFVKDQDRVPYEELDRMRLVDTHGWKPSSRTDAERRQGMRWLAARLSTVRKG